MAEPGHLRDSVQGKVGDASTNDTSETARALSCLSPPSFSDACGFINRRYSCLVVKTHRRHLALSPKFLQRKRSGIKEYLSAELLKYNAALEGVPVAYDNIKLVGALGDIHDDIGFIHINIEADFVIFQPTCGERLVGVVNKKAPSHIGCLVHGCFNASIPKPLKIPVDVWQQMEVNIGDEMEFEVFRLDSDAVGVFFIRGRLDKKLEAEALKLKATPEEQNANLPSDELQNGSEMAEEAVVGEPSVLSEPAPKKERKRVFDETLSQNECIENQEEEAPKKKRKKHRRHLEVPAQDHSVVVHGSGDNSAKETSSKHQGSLRNSDNDVAVDSSVGGLDDTLIVPSSQARKSKKSKKKKHKDRPDLESSVYNGISEESTIGGDSTSEGLGREPGATKKKPKKTSMILDEDLADGAASCPGSPTDNFVIQRETPKKKKHKKKCSNPY